MLGNCCGWETWDFDEQLGAVHLTVRTVVLNLEGVGGAFSLRFNWRYYCRIITTPSFASLSVSSLCLLRWYKYCPLTTPFGTKREVWSRYGQSSTYKSSVRGEMRGLLIYTNIWCDNATGCTVRGKERVFRCLVERISMCTVRKGQVVQVFGQNTYAGRGVCMCSQR